MCRFTAPFAGLLLALALVATVVAQGRLIINDPLEQIRQPDLIRQAAAPLIERGGFVVVYVKARGNDADFIQLLKRDGFVRDDGKARVELVAIYVAIADNYSALRYGERWRDQLDGRYRQILRDHLSQPLSSPNLSQDISAALAAVEASVNPLALFDARWVPWIAYPLGTFLLVILVVVVVRRMTAPAQPRPGHPLVHAAFPQATASQRAQAAALDQLAQRFIAAVERVCANAGTVQPDSTQKLLFQDVRLALLRLRRGHAGVWSSAYTPAEELNRLEQQLKDFERSLSAPLPAVTGYQWSGPASASPVTAVDAAHLQTFRQALQAAAQQWWRLDWALAEAAARSSEFDTSGLFQRLRALLFETTLTDDSAPAAIAEARAIEAEAAAMAQRWMQRLLRPTPSHQSSSVSPSFTNDHDDWDTDRRSVTVWSWGAATASASSDSGWGDLGGGGIDSGSSSDSGGGGGGE
ncbi:hypothetical protein A6A03_08190 [Chloroflexus islandicus]|uniref:Uncharacterized protein n=1 Tax=Chloroflexus islandicus TaxID=1707952 RepID=A0A178MI19_9CHLR|nr:hypothetical protein [Chloroflexus islandicus]OAN48352.1 hypothetical protein A6A03_08190 [Chloroflexus islandicus]